MQLAQNLKPREWVDEFVRSKQSIVRSIYGETQFLLFDLSNHKIDLQSGLSVTTSRPSSALLPAIGSMTIETGIQSQSYSNTIDDCSERPLEEKLRMIIVRGVFFVCPLRKGMHRDSGDPERISVGRARNQDILVRHHTVSKAHACFERDQVGVFFLTDLGSKNGTSINGNPLEPKNPTSLSPGDRIAFGGVKAIIIPSEPFWSVLQEEK